MQNKKLLLGAHISIAGGVQNALYKGSSIGCTAVQIFTQSNRQWGSKTFTAEDINAFREAQKTTNITHVLSHASYLINLASDNPDTRDKSLQALKLELARCKQLGIRYIVLHPGSGSCEEDALNFIAEGINQALDSTGDSDTQILLEVMAGQGSSVGAAFEQLATIRSKIHKQELVGICFDTCHAWAAGYVFNTASSYAAMWKQFDQTIGLGNLKAFHLNDSAKAYDSHVDRHANIGQGTIGIEAFKLILNDPQFAHVPKIIETPKEPKRELEDDSENLKVLLSLLES